MKIKCVAAVTLAALGAMSMSSCETATGTGALIGAGAGAAIASGGPGHHRHHRGNTIAGAAVGAGVGALIGAAIDAENANRYGPRRSTYPYGRSLGGGMVQSPYPPHQVYDLRGVPRGALVDDRVGRGYFRKP